MVRRTICADRFSPLMPVLSHPQQHPLRALLHNEVHARPAEAIEGPAAIAHVVMLADPAQREASRAHLAALLHDHHCTDRMQTARTCV